MEILGVAAVLTLLTFATGSIIKQHSCNLEGGAELCGWQIVESTAGITRASDTTPPALSIDYNPGTENGSYIYFNGTNTLSTETRVLEFPTQKHLLNISFAYFISSSLELTLVQENVRHVIIESNQTQIKWEKASYVLAPPAETDGIILSVDTFDLGEGQVDPQAAPLIIGIDDIAMTYQIPCDYDLLNQPGNLVLVAPSPLQQLPLGTVTQLMFNASSSICPNGPFVFQITSVIPSALEPIFTINVTTGAVTIDTTGPHLLVQGANNGLVTVSVHVADSDYANSGIVSRRKYPMPFVQPRTIVVLSPHNITVGVNTHFSYNVETVSNIGQNVTFQLTNLTTVPASLANDLMLNGSYVTGIISYDSIADISDLTGFPSFTVQVRDSYGGTLTHSVQLIIPQLPPIFDSPQYTFNVSEQSKPGLTHSIGKILVLDPNGDTCQDMMNMLSINSTDTEIQMDFHAPLLPTDTAAPFCAYQLVTTAYLNYEARTSYSFSVVATDTAGLSSTASVIVNVLPVNEFSPSFVLKNVPGEISDHSPIGTEATSVEATDMDSGSDGVLEFSITAGNSPPFFRIIKTSANMATILVADTPVSPGKHILTVTVSDEGNPSKTDTATVNLTVIANNIVDCSATGLGPPQLTVTDTYPTMQPIHSTVTFYCNNTANPPSFPIVWFHQSQSMPLPATLVTSDHYTIANDSLTLHNITTADDGLYVCNVTNLCGYTKRTILMTIIDLPFPPTNVSISQGPFWNNISLSWEPFVNGPSAHPVSGYTVTVRVTGQDEIVTKILLPQFTAGSLTSSVLIDGLLPGTSYTVSVAATNMIGETLATPVEFMTLFSAPRLSMLAVSNHPNDQLNIQWLLEYTGGSPNVTMTIMIRAQDQPETETTYTVPVNQASFQSPMLDSGLSYDIIATVSTSYGSSQYTANAFIGITDNTTCQFDSSSTCQWLLQQANLTSALTAPSPLPSTDAIGSSPAYYISGQPLTASASSVHLIRYPSLSYVCGYSFYYQTQNGVRLVLKATNGILWWDSGVTGTSGWERVNVTVGELPPEVDENVGVEFVMERVGSWSTLSYAAIDDITLHFCLPCDISSVQLDQFTSLHPSFFKVYLRSQQNIQITTSVQGCPHAQLKYTISSVIPNELKPYFTLPSSSNGKVVVSDITSSDAAINTEGQLEVQVGIAQADYKHQGVSLTDTLSIRFLVGEKFQNCSVRSSCDFEINHCNWDIKNQSNIFINKTEDNSFLIAYPPLSSTSSLSNLWRYVINDSYCGISFQYMLERTELQVTVDGLGTIWNSELEATMSPSEGIPSWESVTIFIDVEGVESLAGRGVEFEMVVYDDGVMGEGVPEMRPNDVFVAVDNITLNPCVDCQVKECSCVSCIQQCTNNPCQPGNYLALEVNRCRPCPVGHYCTDWRQPPTPCPIGTYNNVTSASSLMQCRPCPRGYYSLQTGAETCWSCPMGYQCNSPSTLPTCDVAAILTSCPSGYYHAASTNNTLSCVQCEPGYACINGVRVPCAAGFYASQPGSTSCIACNPGHHCPNNDQQPLECPAGQYSPQGMILCQDCATGYTSQAASSQCTISGVSLSSVVAGVMGALVGIIITLLLTTVCCACYCFFTRRRRQLIKNRERKMYRENFLLNPDENMRSTHGKTKRTGKGPHTGTVSTIMSLRSLMSSTSDDTTMSFKNAAYDSDNESDGEMEPSEYSKTPFSDQGNDVIDWRDTNPFIHTSPSESDMSVMVELEGEGDHVWPALARKKKESKM